MIARQAAVAAALLAGAGAASANQATGDMVAEGRQLAESLCAVCHLRGNVSEKSAGPQIPGFVAIAQRPGQTVDGVVAWLASVPPMMPNHHLTRDERDKLAAYILSLRGN